MQRGNGFLTLFIVSNGAGLFKFTCNGAGLFKFTCNGAGLFKFTCNGAGLFKFTCNGAGLFKFTCNGAGLFKFTFLFIFIDLIDLLLLVMFVTPLCAIKPFFYYYLLVY